MNTQASEVRTGVQRFDVAILGSGIAGGTMACILAKHGLRVVIFDDHVHPRFALGESTIGETSCMLKLLAVRYDVPELEHCSSVEGLEQHVASSCGMKLNFGFVYHREGKEQQPDESTQCSVNTFPFGPESHLYRQDVDAYLLHSAVRYGAVPRQKTVISKVEVASDGVRLETTDHDVYEVEYVVDGTGHDSLLARTFDLRDTPTRFKTHSRALFTHMVGVPAFDDVITRSSGQPTPWSKGTLHHMFDGGWIWAIPFDNRPGSTNTLCSVGANLDSRTFPRPTDITPQEEWDRLIARFPTVRKQFANAHPVRNWVSTGRIQYSSRQTVGDRWMLMSHAAGAVDALFSRGMANTFQVLNSAAAMLLDAFKDRRDFSAERFNYIERMNQTALNFNDQLVHGAYVAFRDFDLWRAWSKVWFLSWHMGFTRIAGTLLDFYERGDRSVFSVFEDAKFPGSFCPDVPEFQETFASLVNVIDRVESGAVAVDEAPATLSRTFAEASFAPTPLNLWDVFRRFHDGTADSMRRMHDWGEKKSPAEIRRYYQYDFQKVVDRYGMPHDASLAVAGGVA
jgi:FADH2 O2-dependent halogenase